MDQESLGSKADLRRGCEGPDAVGELAKGAGEWRAPGGGRLWEGKPLKAGSCLYAGPSEGKLMQKRVLLSVKSESNSHLSEAVSK